jgi:Tol biopolymer transport system component
LAAGSARHKEVMQGDLKAAIEQYRKIAAQFAKQPEIAARALFQLGHCQEKLGQAEARKSYERIVREYGAAQQYASAARLRLAALGGGAPAGQQATRVVWTGPNVSAYASSPSPDGRSFTFPHWDTGNLGLHDLVTGADRLLTNTGNWKEGETAYAEGSAISRDGKQAAYAWYDHKLGSYELWVLSLSGETKPRRVFGNANVRYIRPRDWSHDGKWIAANLSDQKTPQIGLIGVQDGSFRLLKTETEGSVIGGFSSDGRYIAYPRRVPDRGLRAYILSVEEHTEVH